MDEKIVELLGKVVEQNAKMLEHNQRVLGFLEKRDAAVAERTALDVEHLKLLIEREKSDAKINEIREREQEIANEEWAKHPGALEEIVREGVLTKIRTSEQDKEWNEKHTKRRQEAK